MGNPKKNQPHQFPEALLHQIFENSLGFVLFTINKEGDIEIFNQFDNETAATALITKARYWSESLEAIGSNNMFQNIVGEPDMDEEEEFLPPPDEED